MSGKLAKKLTPWQALLFIVLSILFISAPAWSAWLVYRKFFDVRSTDPKYNIAAIIQTGPKNEALKTSYLAELLDLSIDNPKNIYQLNLKEEQEKLKSSGPIIKHAILKRILPATLYIDYTLKEPICEVADLTNTGVDEEGYTFPLKPFFSQRKLPEIYLGLNQRVVWGEKIEDERFVLALKTFQHCQELEKNFEILRIDVADALAESLGKKQIVVLLRKEGKEFILRLPCEGISQTLKFFEKLFSKLGNEFSLKTIVDLRLPKHAFINL